MSNFYDKIEKLLTRLTLDEKIALLSGEGTYHTKGIGGLPSILMHDGPNGLRKKADGEGENNLMHKSAAAVCYPSLSTCANSWDEELIFNIGAHIGAEASAERVNIVLGPGVNIKRSPLCGRNFEYFSEDPLLSGRLGAAWIKGVQSEGVGASVKHFCCNNQEDRRMTISSEIDERTLREIYLKPFEIAVKEANPATVMCSYNRVNGTFVSDCAGLLNDILVKEWGFSGFVVTDWGAMNDRVAAVKAGVSLEMPDSLGFFDGDVRDALKRGALREEEIDACLAPMLEKIFELKESGGKRTTADHARHHLFGREAAAKSTVLLKNEDVLPLDGKKTLCVLGAFAGQTRYQGTGSSRVNPYRVETLLDGIKEYGVRYVYEPAFSMTNEREPQLLERALALAEGYDTVLLTLGLPERLESEGFDRESMALPAQQNELVARLLLQGKRVAVVLFGGGSMELPWADAVEAILFMGLPGEAAGGACADVLLGRANPCGKLAESWPVRYEDHIASSYWHESDTQALYREGIYVGYRYFDTADVPVRFPFGHGLSYTRFSYYGMDVRETEEGFAISFTVKNEGEKDGAETVQLYVSARGANVHKPEQELRWFQKVYLRAGEEKRVEVTLLREAFSHFDVSENGWRTENGMYELRLGASSRDVRLRHAVFVGFGKTYEKADEGWHSKRQGIPQKEDLERARGFRVEPVLPYCRGNYDFNASLGELSRDCLLARVILKAGRFVIAKGLGRKPDDNDPQFRMMATVARTAPLRNLALTAPRSMSNGMARLIIRWANGFQGNIGIRKDGMRR